MAVTRHADNKGNRDEKVPLHALVVNHLRTIQSFDERSSRGNSAADRCTTNSQGSRTQPEFTCPALMPATQTTGNAHRLVTATVSTLNAEQMTRELLQALMRHRDPNTTDLYVNYAKQLNPTVAKLHVSEILRAGTAG